MRGYWTRAAAARVGYTKGAHAELSVGLLRARPSRPSMAVTAPLRAFAGEANRLNLTPRRAQVHCFVTACGRRIRVHLLHFIIIITMEFKERITVGLMKGGLLRGTIRDLKEGSIISMITCVLFMCLCLAFLITFMMATV